jgi:hypothetical protein
MCASSRLIPVYLRLDRFGKLANNKKTTKPIKIMKLNKTILPLAAFAGLALVGTSAHAALSIDFDSYTPGDINGQGPWVDFGGTLPANVTTAQAFSGSQSLELQSDGAGYGSDVYIENLNGAPVTSGQWNLSFQTYLPTGYDGSLALYHSQGAMPSGFAEGAFMVLRGDSGFIDNAGSSASLVYNQWAEIELAIDLDNDTLAISYNGTQFHTGAWDTALTGTPSIGGIDWWQDGAGSVSGISAYIDDVSLTQVPEPSSAALLGLGGLALMFRRRK